jgi:hypothetical protein
LHARTSLLEHRESSLKKAKSGKLEICCGRSPCCEIRIIGTGFFQKSIHFALGQADARMLVRAFGLSLEVVMSGASEIFADGIGEIALVGGMVRIDLVSLSQTVKNESGEAVLELRERVVMSPEGFLRSFSAMENLVKQLVDAGLLRKSGDDEAATASPVSVKSEVAPASPNFSTE